MGGNPRYKGSPWAPQERMKGISWKELERTARDEGNARSKEQLDSRQPTLQEATTQAQGIGQGQDKSNNKEVNRLQLPSVITAHYRGRI